VLFSSFVGKSVNLFASWKRDLVGFGQIERAQAAAVMEVAKWRDAAK